MNIISVGYNKRSDIKITKIEKFLNYKLVTIKTSKDIYKLKVKEQIVKNIAFAIATLEILKLNIYKIVNKFKEIKVLEGRGKIFKVKYKNINFNLIDETYNANPLSMKQSIMNLSNLKSSNNKYILLGDMLELGEKSQTLHKGLSSVINNSSINKIFVHGNHIMDTYKNIKKKKEEMFYNISQMLKIYYFQF